MKFFKTLRGTVVGEKQVRRLVSGYSRICSSYCEGRGYVLVVWWGTASAPTDARAYGPAGAVLADSVDGVNKLMGWM